MKKKREAPKPLKESVLTALRNVRERLSPTRTNRPQIFNQEIPQAVPSQIETGITRQEIEQNEIKKRELNVPKRKKYSERLPVNLKQARSQKIGLGNILDSKNLKNAFSEERRDQLINKFNKMSKYIHSADQREDKHVERLNTNIQNKNPKGRRIRNAQVMDTIREESKNDILRENLK